MRWNLDTGKNSPEVSTVIAIVEQGNVPLRSQRGQELHQRTRTFRKFKAIELFVDSQFAVPAYHVTQMQFGQFVMREIKRRESFGLERLFDFFHIVGIGGLHTHEM